jgi:hypothetical protein
MPSTINQTRRSLLVASATLPTLALAATGKSDAKKTHAHRAQVETVAVEQTYLKAQTGLYPDLVAYLKANWLVMDQQAVDQGFFTGYQLMINECTGLPDQSATLDQAKPKTEECKLTTDWQLVMVVSYPQAKGYDDPATKVAFDAIRRAHKEVLINGKNFKALGTIVQHQRYRLL